MNEEQQIAWQSYTEQTLEVAKFRRHVNRIKAQIDNLTALFNVEQNKLLAAKKFQENLYFHFEKAMDIHDDAYNSDT